MRLTVLAIGSRGDVEPFLALGRELGLAGHAVTVATHPRFGSLVRQMALDFAPLSEGAISQGPSTEEGRRWQALGRRRLVPAWVGLLADARTVACRRLDDALRACADADAIIASDLSTLLGWQMAEHYGRPLIRANLNLPAFRRGWSGPAQTAARRWAWRTARPWLNAMRRDAGLPALPRIPAGEPLGELDRRHTLTLRPWSPSVGPRPAADRDWIKVTGYWFVDRRLDPDPSPELESFLDDGPPPVCVDFGSMLDPDPRVTVELVAGALRRAGQRGVFVRGRYRHADVELPDTIFGVDSVPHSWLFERCAAVVHHAGAGTTAAALRAGVPSVPVPHMVDQSRWARRIRQLGVASAPIPRGHLSADGLTDAVGALIADPDIRTRALSLSRRVRAEHGAREAATILVNHLGQDRPALRRKAAA